MRPLKLNSWVTGLGIALSLALFGGLRISAHQVQTAEDIGGTLHIEPNDRPIAGDSVLVWFALTRRGGAPLRLEDCNCAVQVFQWPVTEGDAPISAPMLREVEAENYVDIPGADVLFPTAGAYTLTISGYPKVENDFKPFELEFDVTVVGQ